MGGKDLWPWATQSDALRTGALLALGATLVLLTACSEPRGTSVSKYYSQWPSLLAEVCASSDTELSLRNLNDFAWEDITFKLWTEEGRDYLLQLSDWPPESLQPAEPLSRPTDFRFRRYYHKDFTYELGSFAEDLFATIDINEPYRADWWGDVVPCQQLESFDGPARDPLAGIAGLVFILGAAGMAIFLGWIWGRAPRISRLQT